MTIYLVAAKHLFQTLRRVSIHREVLLTIRRVDRVNPERG